MRYIKPRLSALIVNCLLAFSYISLNSFITVTDTAKTSAFKLKTIVIDAGHGGKDPGAHGSYSSEKAVALSIAKKLRAALADQMPGVNLIMTRKDDTFIELSRRSAIANENKGNLFISIHCNSSPEGTAKIANKQKGAELLVYGLHREKEQLEAIRENSSIYIEKDYKSRYASYNDDDPTNQIIANLYLQHYRKQSIRFASLVNDEFKTTDNRTSHGVKEQGVFVLARSAMPAVLVETGFINNPVDEEYLNSEAGQNEIVQAIVTAVKRYKKDM